MKARDLAGLTGLDHPLLTKEREAELGRIVQKGGTDAEEAVTEFIRCNQLLVLRLAKTLAERCSLDIEDAFGYGQEGLMLAARRFDPARGCRFSTFASNWIKNKIRRGGAHAHMIKLPEYLIGRVPHASISRMGKKLGRLPIAAVDNSAELTEETEEVKTLVGRIREAMQGLTPHERGTIDSRYLAGPGREESRTQLAERQGISRAAVDDSERRGIKKLKAILATA